MRLGRDAVAISMLAGALFRRWATFDWSIQEPVRNGVLVSSAQVLLDVNSANAQTPALGHWAIP